MEFSFKINIFRFFPKLFLEVDFFHMKKSKFSKSKNYFHKVFIYIPYVSNLQLPTPSRSLLGKHNVPETLDFPQSPLLPSSPSYVKCIKSSPQARFFSVQRLSTQFNDFLGKSPVQRPASSTIENHHRSP